METIIWRKKLIRWIELWWIKGLQENTMSKFYMALTIRKWRTIKVGKSQANGSWEEQDTLATWCYKYKARTMIKCWTEELNLNESHKRRDRKKFKRNFDSENIYKQKGTEEKLMIGRRLETWRKKLIIWTTRTKTLITS